VDSRNINDAMEGTAIPGMSCTCWRFSGEPRAP